MESAVTLMTAEQCAAFAGVSLDTVRQYQEFGLLQTVEREGTHFFKEADVASIFHLSAIKGKPAYSEQTKESTQSSNPFKTASNFTAASPPEPQNIIPLQNQIEVEKSEPQADGSSLRIVELLQLNQALREQLEMVKEERDWLRARQERLEARSEREQMLLLSESETVRSLINQRMEKKRPFWAFALPWNNPSS